ncbi:MAG: type I glyceraldehyde-3-phosphate dehydrogenase [Alphaproteobacteria bacterium]
MARIAINGFGRIGRLALRAFAERKPADMEIVAINDLGDSDDNAHLFKYDSVHGTFPGDVTTTKESMNIGLGDMSLTSIPNPQELPWDKDRVDIVLECSGRFASRDGGNKHLQAGARKVLISAPAGDVDATVVYGVNHDTIDDSHKIVSNASCTTNCLAPIASVLHKSVGIENGYMTTIHAYTADQRLVDTMHKDKRRMRAAALSMIPTSTGAAKAVGLVLPELAGKLDGTAIRVPTPNVSMIDFTFTASRATSVEEINHAVQTAAEGPMKGVIGIVTAPLVSIDFNHCPFSASFDATQTTVMDGTLCRVLAWYDNEWGFANRMIDMLQVL